MSDPTSPTTIDEQPPAAPRVTEERPLPAVDQGTVPSIPQTVSYSTESRGHARRKPVGQPDPLFAAKRAIAGLTDDGPMSTVERSNLFDDWKEALMRVAETGVVRSGCQRQVVGMLLSAIRQKDAVDFTREQLMAFRGVTNIAGANPLQADANRAARDLTRVGVLRPLGLSPDGISNDDEAELAAIMARFVKAPK